MLKLIKKVGKDKIRRFAENATFKHMFQPEFDEVFNANYKLKGNWLSEVFNNNNPIVLELGCGKGEYTVAMAQKYPDKNFIGIDIKGARMWRGAKTAQLEGLKNVAFLRTRIEFIASCFQQDEVSEIWITFPDPQRKNRRATKRLTASPFLARYRTFLRPKGIVHLKTDSYFLHEYTKALLKENNLQVNIASPDIYNDGTADEELSIKTHYEKIYLDRGVEITYLQFLIEGNESLKEPESFDPNDFD